MLPKLFISSHWTLYERLEVIGNISARFGNDIEQASREDIIDAMKAIRMVARLNTEVMELNRGPILQLTEPTENFFQDKKGLGR